MSKQSDRAKRIKQIAAILIEESVATYIPYDLGMTLEGEAETIDVVRSSRDGPEELPGYMLGVAPGATPESLARAARRILTEVV